MSDVVLLAITVTAPVIVQVPRQGIDWPTLLASAAAFLAALAALIRGYLAEREARRVAAELEKTTRSTAVAVEAKVDAAEARVEATAKVLVAKVEAVHKATNSLTDRLVETTAAEALVRGGVEERARADERLAAETRSTKP